MKPFRLILLPVLMFLANGCEKHPLPGAAPAHGKEVHSGGKAPGPGEAHDAPAKPAPAAPH